jgi:hypothetical protein
MKIEKMGFLMVWRFLSALGFMLPFRTGHHKFHLSKNVAWDLFNKPSEAGGRARREDLA